MGRFAFVVVGLVMAVAMGCGSNVVVGGGGDDDGDCGPFPEGVDCIDACGFMYSPSCVQGSWDCVDPGGECDCGPMPGAMDCIDECGNMFSPSCVDGAWDCVDPGPDCYGSKGAIWSSSYGSDEYEQPRQVVMDGAGNVYVATQYRQLMELEQGPAIASVGGYDTLLVRYSVSGEVVWAVRFGGAGDDLPQGLAMRPDGDLLLAMSSSDQPVPGGVGPVSLLRVSVADGSMLATQPLGIPMGMERQTRVVSDPSTGAVVVAGSFQGELSWNGPTLTGVGLNDVFVVKLDAEGNHLWSRAFGSPSHDYAVGLDLDEAGNVFVAGTFKGPMTVDTVSLSPEAEFDGFVVSLDPSGEARWGRALASPGAAVAGDVTAYGDGGVVVTVTFETELVLDGFHHQASGADPEALVARLDGAGATIFAATHGPARAGGSGASHRGWKTAVDASGDVMVTGTVHGEVENDDVLLVRLDPQDGAIRWSVSFGDDNSNSVADVVCRDGLMAIIGTFFGGMNFGNGQLESHIQGAGFVALFDIEAPTM